MESPTTVPTLDPMFEEYLTRRLQEYADAAAEMSPTSPTSPPASLNDDTDSGIHGNAWNDDDDAYFDSPGSSQSFLSTASCPTSPAPQRHRLGYRPQRPTYDPTRGILKSITEGNTRRLSKLLGRRHSTAASQEDLSAPLVQAIRMGQDKCVMSLLAAGADPNGTDDEGKTPLYLVMEAAGGNPEILRALLKAKANPDQATWNLQHTPLHLAAKKGYQVGVKQLLAAGARPDKKDAAGNVPLMLAAKEGHVNIVRALLREGANPNGRNLTNESPVHFAAKGGNVDCLRELLEAGADPNDRDTRGQTPLLLACKLKHTKAVEVLLDYECDVNGQDTSSGKTALHWSIQNGELNQVTELLDAGADPNIKDKNWTTPFLLALSAGGTRDILELLLHAGCDVTVTDRSFNTAIHLAASEGQADLLPALVEAGINVDIKGPGGVTSLMLAAYGGHLATVKQLLQFGAGVNLMDRNRASALMYAILSKANDDIVFDIIKLLIRSNCELNYCANLTKLLQHLNINLGEGVEVDDRLYSPIEVAYLLSKTAIFMMLIKAGANTSSFSDSLTPLMMAQKPQDGEQRNRWYLLHCLKKEQQEIKSLVELCRRPAVEFLSRQYKGRSISMPQKIARLPFTDRVKSFLNYDDLDEVQSKYNVTLREKQPQKATNGHSRTVSRDSATDDKKRLSSNQSSLSNLRTSFRRSNTGLNRNSSARQSLPIGYNNSNTQRPSSASSTPSRTPNRTSTTPGRHSLSFGDSGGSQTLSKPRRTSLNFQSSTSRLSSSSRDDAPHREVSLTSPRRFAAPTPSRTRPSSASTYSSGYGGTGGGRMGLSTKAGSSNNLELTRNMENRLLQQMVGGGGSGTQHYGSLKTRRSGREAEYERLEQAYDQLRNSMIAAGSISDMSSSSSSLCDSTKQKVSKRRGRYGQLDPTQMLLSPAPSEMATSPPSTNGDNDVFFNGDVSPRSVSDDSSMHSGSCRDRVSASSPTESKSSGEEVENKQPIQVQRPTYKYHNLFNGKPSSPHHGSYSSVQKEVAVVSPMTESNNDEWGLKCLKIKPPNKDKVDTPDIIMDEQEKQLLETIVKQAEENTVKKPLANVAPDERPLRPMSEETKKTIYDKRWARVPNPVLNISGQTTPEILQSPRTRSRQGSESGTPTSGSGLPQKRFTYSTEIDQDRPRSSLRSPTSPTGLEKKEVRFSPSSEKLAQRMKEKNGNVNELDDDLHLKRWGTMTLDDPEVLDNSENFTSSRSLQTPTGKRMMSERRTGTPVNNLNNNRPVTPTKPLTSPRSTTPVSQPRSYAEIQPKVRSRSSSSSGNGSVNRSYGNTNGQIANQAYLDENYRNQNGHHAKVQPQPTYNMDSRESGQFNRGTPQYSSVRVRGTYGQRTSPMVMKDNTSSLDRSSRKRSGMRSKDSGDVTSESPLTSPAEKKEVWFGSHNENAGSDTKKSSAGSKIKMAFLRSRSFRH